MQHLEEGGPAEENACLFRETPSVRKSFADAAAILDEPYNHTTHDYLRGTVIVGLMAPTWRALLRLVYKVEPSLSTMMVEPLRTWLRTWSRAAGRTCLLATHLPAHMARWRGAARFTTAATTDCASGQPRYCRLRGTCCPLTVVRCITRSPTCGTARHGQQHNQFCAVEDNCSAQRQKPYAP